MRHGPVESEWIPITILQLRSFLASRNNNFQYTISIILIHSNHSTILFVYTWWPKVIVYFRWNQRSFLPKLRPIAVANLMEIARRPMFSAISHYLYVCTVSCQDMHSFVCLPQPCTNVYWLWINFCLSNYTIVILQILTWLYVIIRQSWPC